MNFLINFFLPLALGVVRSYLNKPMHDHDDKVLNVVKQSVQYLASCDNNTVSFGHVASIGNACMIENNNEGLKNG